MLALQARAAVAGCASDARARASSRSPGARTSASRRSSTRSSATRWRSSPTSRRRRGARSAASPTREPTWQLVLIDLPGVQRPRDALTRRMQRRVEQRARATPTPRCSCVNGEQGVGGPGDRFIAEALRGAGVPVVDRRQQGRPARPRAHRRRAAGRRRPRPRRRDLPGLGAHRARASAPLVDAPRGAAARGTVLLPARRGLRPARATCCSPSSCASRCCARTRQEVPHAVEVAGRGDRATRDDLITVRALAVGRDRVAEGHPDRQRRAR